MRMRLSASSIWAASGSTRKGRLGHGLLALLLLALGSSSLSFSSISLKRSQARLEVKSWNPGDEPEDADEDAKEITKQICQSGRKRNFLAAKEAFEEAEVKDAIMYSAIIGAAANCKEFDEGMAYFEEIQSSSLEAGDSVYSATLKLLGIQGNYEEASRIWQQMVDTGLLKRSSRQQGCLTGLLNAAASAGDVELVLKDMDAAQATGVELNPSHFGCLLKACRQSRDLENAEKALKRMRTASIPANIIHYTIYMGACARFVADEQPGHAAAVELEQKVLSMMDEDMVKPNDYFLEERILLHLGIASLRDWLYDEDAPRPGDAELQGAAQVLEEAIADNIRLTLGLRELRERLPALQAASEKAYALLNS
ncbi:Rf1 [Symbiodinium microadriaticum]|nr:Rf1 [Symbiodinium microadriaticum]